MREAHQIVAGRVGRRLKDLRGELTQTKFAEQMGISQAQYNRYETGKRLAPDRVLREVARLREVTPEEVVWGPSGAGPPGDLAAELAKLLVLLDPEDRHDLYLYLKVKTEALARRRQREARQAQRLLSSIMDKAG